MHLIDHNIDRNIADIAAIDANRKCFECGGQSLWASVSLGIFLCLKHAGEHRHLGTHLSTVRSLTLDKWQPKQVKFMQLGGNQRAKFVFSNQEGDSLEAKYNSPVARQYRETLEQEVNLALGITEKNEYVPLDPALERFANAKSFGSSDFRREGDDVRVYSSNYNLCNCCTIL